MKKLFTTIEQVSYTVKDVDAVVSFLKDAYGIGPWKCVNFGYLDNDAEFNSNTIKVENGICEGKYIGKYGLKIGQSVVGNTEIELIQPLDDKSLFAKYLERNGQGGQHLAIDKTIGFSEFMGIMAEQGFPLAQISKIDDIEDCAFIDHMRMFGTYLELHQRPEDFQMPESFQKTAMLESDKENVLGPVVGISIIVQDLTEALAVINSKYGIEPWIEGEIDAPGTCNVLAKAAYCNSLNLDITLIQPVDKTSSFYKYINEKGPGIYETIFEPQDERKAVKALSEAERHMVSEYTYQGYTYKAYDHSDLFGGNIAIRTAVNK